MLALAPHVHWIIVEDANENTKLVTNLLQHSSLINYTHLSIKTPVEKKARRLVSMKMLLLMKVTSVHCE